MAEPKTWAERFPHPGAGPPAPAEEEPTREPEFEAWWQARFAWNNYVRAHRAHAVAVALDELIAKENWLNSRAGQPTPALSAADRIAQVLGASFLDGSVPNAGPYLGMLAL